MDLDTFFSAVLLISAVGFAFGALTWVAALAGGRAAKPGTLVMTLSLLVYLVGGAAGAAVRVQQEVRLGGPNGDASNSRSGKPEAKGVAGPKVTSPSSVAASPTDVPKAAVAVPADAPPPVAPAKSAAPVEHVAPGPEASVPVQPPAAKPAEAPKPAAEPKKKKREKRRPAGDDAPSEPAALEEDAPGEPAEEPAPPPVLEPKADPKKPELLEDPG